MKPFLRAFFAIALIVGGVVGLASPAQAALTYFHAGGRQTLTTPETSVAGFITVLNPTLTAGDFHSLYQLTAQSTDGQQVIEVGWTKDPTTYGDSNIHLFATRWTNGAFGGYFDSTWVDYGPNATDRNSSISGAIGSVKPFAIVYSSGNWWIQYDSANVGYFPGSDWTSPSFTSFKLFQGFGEVAANVASPTTQMGNGNCGNSGLTSGKVSSVQYSSGTAGVSLTTFATDSTKYSVYGLSARTVYAGGDGSCP